MNYGCYNCGEKGHNQDRYPRPRKFCTKGNLLGHTHEMCTRGKKREGGALSNLRPTSIPSPLGIRDGFTNVIS